MADVFISYSRKDIAFARLIQQSLQQSQVDTWIDWDRIPVGEKWWTEICEAIENANVFMFIISKNSIGSPVCKDEINQALRNNKRIIPIIVDDMRPDAIKEFAPDLPQFNWIIFEKDHIFRVEENPQARSDKPEDNQVALPLPPQFQEALEKLSNAIHTDWEWVKYHTRLQVNALLWENNDRNPSYLVRGTALEEAEQQLLRASGKDPKPTGLQAEYVTASRKEQTLRQQEQLRLEQKARGRQRLVIWAVGIGLVVAMALGVIAWGQRNVAVSQGNMRATAEANAVDEAHTRATAEANALEQRDIAVVRQLAAQSRSLANEHLDDALLLAVEADQRLGLSDSHSSLLYAVSSQPELTRYLPQRGWGWGGLAYSPNGRLLAIGTVDHNVLLIDAGNGEAVAASLTGLDSEVLSLAFSPDGHSLVAGDNSGLVLRWDISNPSNPKQTGAYRININANPMMITMASDMRPLQVGYFPASIYLWNLPASQPVNICTCGITSLAFSPNGSALAVGLGSGAVTLLDLTNGREIQTLAAYRNPGDNFDSLMALDLAFTPDSKKLVLSTAYGYIRIWDLITGNAQAIPRSSLAPVLSRLALSPDGKNLAYIIDGSSAIYLMDMESQQFQKYPLQSGEEILSLAFYPDGHRLALGLADNTIQTWDVQSHLPIGVPLQGHHGEVIFLSFNPDGHRFASVDWEHTFIMWDLQAADRLLTTTDTPTDAVGNIALSADGQYLATVADIQYGTRLNIRDMKSNSSTGQTLSEAELGLSPVASDISFLSDTHELVFYGYASDPFESQILLWDVDRREPVWRISSASAPLALSPDGRWLAGINKTKGEQAGKVALWDTQTGTLLRELEDSSRSVNGSNSPVKDELKVLSFSPDSSLLAEGWGSGAVRLWHVDNGQPASPMLTGHFDQVTGLAFSPDGKTLASSSRDKTIRLWNVAQPSTSLVELDGHTSWATGVAFSPDGRFLATTSLDGSTRIWDSQSYLRIGQLAGIEITQTFNPVFSTDGSRLFSGGTKVMDMSGSDSWGAYYDRGLVLQWEFGPAGWSNIGCSIVQRNFSLSEWRSYFGTEAYRKTCEALPLHPSVVERFFQSEQTNLVAGGLQAALDDFVKKLPLDLALTGELEASLKAFPLEDITRDTAQRVDTGEVDPAVEMYQAVRSLGRAEQVSARTWNEICWFGSLWKQAVKVLDICELAVSLEPSNVEIRDSRGLALALIGKTDDAIQDFQALVDWCKQNGCSGTIGSQREQWIAALKSGQNPFDEQTLQSLRNP